MLLSFDQSVVDNCKLLIIFKHVKGILAVIPNELHLCLDFLVAACGREDVLYILLRKNPVKSAHRIDYSTMIGAWLFYLPVEQVSDVKLTALCRLLDEVARPFLLSDNFSRVIILRAHVFLPIWFLNSY